MACVVAAQSAVALQLEKTSYRNLPGWLQDDHGQALKVFAHACRELTTSGVGFTRKAKLSGNREDWLEICRLAEQTSASPESARRFFEQHLAPVRITDVAGQFTGYFEPELEGSRTRSKGFDVPVLARPDDLVRLSKTDRAKLGVVYGRVVNGKAQTYLTRRQIEEGGLSAQNLDLVYLRSWPDLFFMQVQGSGRVRLREGGHLRLAYAAKTGLP